MKRHWKEYRRGQRMRASKRWSWVQMHLSGQLPTGRGFIRSFWEGWEGRELFSS
jgi:hypothetical protein